MVDVEVFRFNPAGHHWTSVVIHAANGVLLFLVLRAMTQCTWPSAFVSALFALHPLHVESVAWVSERKDVLSTFFWFAAMGAYLRYVRKPGLGTLRACPAPLQPRPFVKADGGHLSLLPHAARLLAPEPLRRTPGRSWTGTGQHKTRSVWQAFTRLVAEKFP